MMADDRDAEGSAATPKTLTPTQARRRILALADQLLRGKYEDPSVLWHWQMELAALQRELQQAISDLKNLKRPGDELSNLQQYRYFARRLGDAFAWLLLGMRKPDIHALSQNAPVPISPEERPSDVGVISIASELYNQGWGFPLIHDITDVLRIGDVTFINPGTPEHPHRTVELKTRVLPGANEPDVMQLEVQLIEPWHPKLGSRDHVKWGNVPKPADDRPSSHRPDTSRRRPDRRDDKQSRRMAQALAHRLAEDGEVTEMPDGSRLLSHSVETESGANWKLLRRLIRDARKDGFASAEIDGAIMYLVFYREERLQTEDIQREELPSALQASSLFDDIAVGRPSLIVTAIPEQARRAPRTGLPFYLYSVPRRAIHDIIHGRLAIIVAYNPAKFATALLSAGYAVEEIAAATSNDPADYVYSHRVAVDGAEYKIEMHGIMHYIEETVSDFQGMEYFLALSTGTPHLFHDGRILERLNARTQE